MTVSDWRLLLLHPQTHRRPKIWSVEYGVLQVRKVLFPPHWSPTKTDFEEVYLGVRTLTSGVKQRKQRSQYNRP